MSSHAERVASARATVDFILGLDAVDMATAVPNCPGWTVHNVAVHVGQMGPYWQQMMDCSPDDAGARNRAIETLQSLPADVDAEQLSAWAHSMLDEVASDEDRECYVSMTGGPGTLGTWACHAASEMGVHRLDVEAAIGLPYSISDTEAIDSATYVGTTVLSALRRHTGEDPGAVLFELLSESGVSTDGVSKIEVESETAASVTVRGPAVEVLLAMWGRPAAVEVTAGDAAVWTHWQELPSRAFQWLPSE